MKNNNEETYWGAEGAEYFRHTSPECAAKKIFEDTYMTYDNMQTNELELKLIEMKPMKIDVEQWSQSLAEDLLESWIDEFHYYELAEPDDFSDKVIEKFKEAIIAAREEFPVTMLEPTGKTKIIKYEDVM